MQEVFSALGFILTVFAIIAIIIAATNKRTAAQEKEHAAKEKTINDYITGKSFSDADKEFLLSALNKEEATETVLANIDRYEKQIAGEKQLESYPDFKITKCNRAFLFTFAMDENKFALILPNEPAPLVYDYKRLINFDIVQNGSQIIQGTSGSAAMGALLFGSAGAVVGSSGSRTIKDICNELVLRMFLDDFEKPQISVPFITVSTYKSSNAYKQACEYLNGLTGLLTYIMNKNKGSHKN